MSPLTTLPAAIPAETPATVSNAPQFLQQLLSHRAALESFLECHLSTGGGDQAILRSIFRQTCATRAALMGEAHLVSWQFGMALNVVRQAVYAHEQSRFCSNTAAIVAARVDLAQALADLPAEARDVLLLLASGDMQIDQASLMAALSLSAVRTHIAACRQRASAVADAALAVSA